MEILYLITVIIFIIGLILAIVIMEITYSKEVKLKEVSEKISDGYVIITKAGKITNYNQAFLKYLNLKEKDVNRKSIRQTILKSDLKKEDIDNIFKVIDDIVEKKDYEFIVNKKNKIFKIEIMNLVENDVFMRYVIIFKDISKNYKMLEELKINQEMLKNRERFATLGGLVTGMTHSLRSPIFAITGEIEGLIDLINEYKESIDDEKVSKDDHKQIATEMQQWLDKIKIETESISDTITAIRSQVVVLNNDEETTFTIEDLMKYVNIIMKNTLKQKLIILNFTIKIDRNYEIRGNFNSLVQVINNLVINAIESYEGKTNETIEIVIEKEEKNIVISVIDNGKGIPESVQKKIFKEMIFDDKNEKAGISLFVSYSNIKAGFNGNMTFESNSNGSKFNIILPDNYNQER